MGSIQTRPQLRHSRKSRACFANRRRASAPPHSMQRLTEPGSHGPADPESASRESVIAHEDGVADDAGFPVSLQHRIAPYVERLGQERGLEALGQPKPEATVRESLIEARFGVVRSGARKMGLGPAREKHEPNVVFLDPAEIVREPVRLGLRKVLGRNFPLIGVGQLDDLEVELAEVSDRTA